MPTVTLGSHQTGLNKPTSPASPNGIASARFCSRCAFDKNPKIPMLVINDRTTTAIVRYVFKRKRVCFQFRYSHDAVTNLPTSKTEPIITTGQNAPGNIVASPMTE